MPRPRVSVVVPTYQRADVLDRAIRSVRAQTFEDWELIVVDDNGEGSPHRDAVRDVVYDYRSDARLRSVEHPTNAGGAAARNTGIRASRGRFVAFLDDDDEWKPAKLARQLERFDEGDERLGLVYTAVQVVDDVGGKAYVERPGHEPGLARRLLGKNVIGTTSSVLCTRRALVDVGGFDDSLPAYQDHDLYLRMAHAYAFAYVDAPLVVRHIHAGERITKNLSSTIEASERVLERHRVSMSDEPTKLAEFLWKQGTMYLDYGDRRNAVRKFATAIRADPWRVDVWPYLIVAAAGPRAYDLARSVKRRTRSMMTAVRRGYEKLIG